MSNRPADYDIAIIGGGIVGLATAYALARTAPERRVLVLEKEDGFAAHQTGHNSGVIHSGIYYPSGSRKARYALEGSRRTVEFCAQHDIPCEVTGKLIVATREAELGRLTAIYERGLQHGLDVEFLRAEQIADHEPDAAGLAAVRVKSAGITNYSMVSAAYARVAEESGVEFQLGSEVRRIRRRADAVTVETRDAAFSARLLVNCAGLHSDKIAELSGHRPSARIVPFRGEYYELKPDRTHLVKNLIYPVPDPSFPFLGVHLTRMWDGSVHVGPNAVLALAREGYTWSRIKPGEVWNSLSYGGFLKLAARNWRPGLAEMHRSFSPREFAASAANLVPGITRHDLVPSAAGVRAQALLSTGALVDDFLIEEADRALHVLNAPSPAATASLPIGDAIAQKALRRLG